MVLRGRLAAGEGREGRGREGGEVDTNAQLEEGRRLAKAGPDSDCLKKIHQTI